jgi:hypothetical protein
LQAARRPADFSVGDQPITQVGDGFSGTGTNCIDQLTAVVQQDCDLTLAFLDRWGRDMGQLIG